jgi:hypothetical protein
MPARVEQQKGPPQWRPAWTFDYDCGLTAATAAPGVVRPVPGVVIWTGTMGTLRRTRDYGLRRLRHGRAEAHNGYRDEN